MKVDLGRHEEGMWVYPPSLFKRYGRMPRGHGEVLVRHYLLRASRGIPLTGNEATTIPGAIPPGARG